MSEKLITVVEVIVDMGLEPEKWLTWMVGQEVADWWESETGSRPLKVLRPKTNGPGTHCHAVYPEWTRPTIERFVRGHETQRRSQGSFFDQLGI